MTGSGLRDLETPAPRGGDAFSATRARLMAYWTDECARDFDKLMSHFSNDAEVVTPDGVYRGRAAVASVYRKSFDDYPGLTVDMKASFVGRETHCFEYSAVLWDAANNGWLVEGVNVMRLEGGLIRFLRSFEDQPRRLSSQEKGVAPAGT